VFFGVNENTVLHVAVEQKDHEKIKSVMEREIRLLAKVNRSGQTPLIMACVSNDTKLARLLLDYYR
jgi:ankyrin repeat protein